MTERFNQGFTLVELLVVIGIIGILSSVVLGSLNSARSKSANAVIKSSLANARPQAELFYDVNGTNYYNGVCLAASVNGVESIRRFVEAANAVSITSVPPGYLLSSDQPDTRISVCHATSNAWAVSVPLKVPEGTALYFCVDSTGTVSVKNSPLRQNFTVCPAS